MPNEEYRPNNVSEQNANGASANRNDLDKPTYIKCVPKYLLNLNLKSNYPRPKLA
jgi:hypothetical protein